MSREEQIEALARRMAAVEEYGADYYTVAPAEQRILWRMATIAIELAEATREAIAVHAVGQVGPHFANELRAMPLPIADGGEQ